MAIATLSLLPSTVEAHGFLARPVPRNVAASGHSTTTFEPQSLGLNAENNNAVHGICGDKPGGPQAWAAPGPVPSGSSHYVEGGLIEFEVRLTAHHLGFFEFELCDTVDITEECFARHRLLRDAPECSAADAAADPHCRVSWKPATESELTTFTVAGGDAYPAGTPYIAGGSSANTFGANFAMTYRLPAGVTCSHCVVRWHYFTTNSCSSPTAGSEEFWNCADISIAPAVGPRPPAPTAAELAAVGGRLVATRPTTVDNVARGNLGCGTFGRTFRHQFVNVGRSSADYARPSADALGCANQPDAGTQGCLFEGGAVGRSVAVWRGDDSSSTNEAPRATPATDGPERSPSLNTAPPTPAAPGDPSASVCRGVRPALDAWCEAVGRADPSCSAYPGHCVLSASDEGSEGEGDAATAAPSTLAPASTTGRSGLVCRGKHTPTLDSWCREVSRRDPTCSAYPDHCELKGERERRTLVLRGRRVRV